MRFFLDENISPRIAEALQFHFYDDKFVSAHHDAARYCSVADVELMWLLEHDKFHAIVTIDKNQMAIAEERAAVRAAGLHWIGMPSSKVPGAAGFMHSTVTLLAGIPLATEAISAATQQLLVKLKGVEREAKQRLTKCEPL